MRYERIPRKNASATCSFIKDEDKFYRFVDDFSIVGVHWSQPYTLSADYFLRLLREGASARARENGKGYVKQYDDSSMQMNDFYLHLLDHGAMWKRKDSSVICTAMPYRTTDSILQSFEKLRNTFDYPDELKLKFMEDEKYRYLDNGDNMIMIHYERQ